MRTEIKGINEYKPFKGFFDLRKFNLPKKLFLKLWQIQEILFHMNNNKLYYKKWLPGQWSEAQNMSAYYQQLLLKYGDPNDIN